MNPFPWGRSVSVIDDAKPGSRKSAAPDRRVDGKF